MSDFRPLELTVSWQQQGDIIANAIKAVSVSGEALKILEAGCGQKWQINLEGVDYRLTGLDLDKAALEMRKNIKRDLHVAIQGDLRCVELPAQQYDVIYSAYVLEHVKGAEQVLDNFAHWIKPGGVMVLLIPDPYSVHGFMTRSTPHWFHVLYHRLLGHRNAGKPGYEPYPVHYDPIVSRKGVHEFCARHDMAVLAEYGDGHYRPGKGAVRRLIHAFKLVLSAASFGRLSARHTNLLYVLKSRAAFAA